MENKTKKTENCGFYGAETVPETLRALYRTLRRAWCRETCAPRLRGDWSEENPTLGQCSITAFLVQELFGGEKLNYENNPVQLWQTHLADADKRSRFELLRARFFVLSETEGLTWRLP